MQFLVFNKIKFCLYLFLFTSVCYAQNFNTNECIQSEFNTNVSHKGLPFGLYDVILKISKKQCQISIYHENFKYLKKNWSIDVCRAPVHIKVGKQSVEVFKRRKSCESSDSEYCNRYKELKDIIQDDGLIFANGQKEDINSDHGRVNCVFILLKEYLNNGFVFSLHGKNDLSKNKKIQIFKNRRFFRK